MPRGGRACSEFVGVWDIDELPSYPNTAALLDSIKGPPPSIDRDFARFGQIEPNLDR